MDHVFGSRWLVNELSRLGFSISYNEVNRYKQSVVQSESLDSLLTEYFPGTFTQWVANNVDHNVATLDGNGRNCKFHTRCHQNYITSIYFGDVWALPQATPRMVVLQLRPVHPRQPV